jgi:hypothetical protein
VKPPLGRFEPVTAGMNAREGTSAVERRRNKDGVRLLPKVGWCKKRKAGSLREAAPEEMGENPRGYVRKWLGGAAVVLADLKVGRYNAVPGVLEDGLEYVWCWAT